MMVSLIVLVLIFTGLGGLGFAAPWLWFVLAIAVMVWVLGFFVGHPRSRLETGRTRRQWYGH